MDAFKISGPSKPLAGTVEIKGAKNAVLPLMIASLLTDEPITLNNVAFLSDVNTLTSMMRDMGAKVTQTDDSITLQCDTISKTKADYEFVSKMFASFWVIGPLSGRFGHASASLPGGCSIGLRAVDMYVSALESLGATVTLDNGYVNTAGKLRGGEIKFWRASVGATHTAIMAAVLAEGTTRIENPALEPEIMDVISLLKKMGANISGEGSKILTIEGVKKLHGTTHTVVPDRIEAATFAIAAAITKGHIFLKNARRDLMETVVNSLTPSNIVFTQKPDGLDVDATNVQPTAVDITTLEYPGFPTDDQPQMLSFLTLAKGKSTVTETIFNNRFMHVPELNRMGAKITLLHATPTQTDTSKISDADRLKADVLDAKSVSIVGVDHLTGARVMSSDLRGGVALVLAGMAAHGETIVSRIYHIDRGYYKLEDKLTALGATIKRINVK